MTAPFLTENDVKIGKETPNGFTLEVNGYDPIECTYDMKFERERKRSRSTGRLMKGFVTVCYPNYYIVVQWSDSTKYKALSLDLAKQWIVQKLNADFDKATKQSAESD